MSNSDDGLGIVVLGLFGLLCFGAYKGCEAGYDYFVGTKGVFAVKCYANNQLLFDGFAKREPRHGWNTITIEEFGTGSETTLDGSATCVSSRLQPPAGKQ